MIKADYHLHTNFSSDSTAPMESMIRQGIASGLEILCFTICLPIKPGCLS